MATSPAGSSTDRCDHPVAWVTGAGGLIGSWLVRLAPQRAPEWTARPLLRSDVDLTQTDAVQRLFRREKPAAIIHCAALSRSTDCQSAPAVARIQNVEVTARLVELAAEIPLLFFSTDLVFDGKRGNYDETAAVNPLSVYAETKAAAERIVLSNPRHSVVRTSLNSGPSPKGDRGFDEQLIQAWKAGQVLRLYTDEFRSPIAARATARAVWELLQVNKPGLYHLAGDERLSRWEIGRLLAASHPELEARIEAASLKEYRGAPRAPDTSLNCDKLQKLLSTPLPRWSDWLKETAGAEGSRDA
jgi:dTDP-4-dehydrorhamnose reductase